MNKDLFLLIRNCCDQKDGPNRHQVCLIISLGNLKSDLPYFIEYSANFFYIENDAEIFAVHYTWKVAEKGFKMAFMMNKLARINSREIILEK